MDIALNIVLGIAGFILGFLFTELVFGKRIRAWHDKRYEATLNRIRDELDNQL